ncbi:MAG: hypothetical protein IPH88_18175 [Bacteroidales bacterium]|nr:hypothetical protein [Bacteroidales bacterium]
MDIENTWKNIEGSDGLLDKVLANPGLRNKPSKHPLVKLRQNLLMGLGWAIAITIGYILLLIFFRIWQVNLALVIMIAFNSWLIVLSWKQYKRTPTSISAALSLKDELQSNYDNFRQWWRIQERVSLFVYPFALAGGFILGATIGSGKTADQLMGNPRVLIILLITMLIMVPVSFYFARLLFRLSYGKHLERLKGLIAELEEE